MLRDNPWAFRHDGRWWVSSTPREEAHARLVEQVAWDRRNARMQRWWVAIAIGAVLGTGLTLGLSMWLGWHPFVNLVILPLGFGIGAVLGALVNKRVQGEDAAHASMPKRPTTPELTLIPRNVVRTAPDDASAADLIRWSKQRYVGDARD